MGKKIKEVKTPEQRAAEVDHIMEQFTELGLPLEHPGVQEFIKISKDFETHGISASGKIKLSGFKRQIDYLFSQKVYITSRIILEHNHYV
jgi:hypothetical protein